MVVASPIRQRGTDASVHVGYTNENLLYQWTSWTLCSITENGRLCRLRWCAVCFPSPFSFILLVPLSHAFPFMSISVTFYVSFLPMKLCHCRLSSYLSHTHLCQYLRSLTHMCSKKLRVLVSAPLLASSRRDNMSPLNRTKSADRQVGNWQLNFYTPFTRYSRLSNRLWNGFDNQFDNRVERTATVRSTGCQTGLYNRLDNRLYTRYSRLSNRLPNRSNGFGNRLNVCIHDTTGCHIGLTTGLTTGCIV